MIARSDKGFLTAHYDWLVLAVGAVVLVAGGVLFYLSQDADADSMAGSAGGAGRPRAEPAGVPPVDMTAFRNALRLTRTPPALTEISEQDESFLASEYRVLCRKCKKAIVGDVKRCPVCPACGEKQEIAQKIVLDSDNDAIPDEWEKRYGLNPNDPSDANADLDGDGFTNLEEYLAGTDPTDPNDHPDYLDSLKIVLPLKKTYMPFVFVAANKIPTGWRCEFFDAKLKDDYGRIGRTLTAVIGEEVGASGYVLRGYEKKSVKRAIPGSVNKKDVDVSKVALERKGDGKRVTLVVSANKKAKPAPVDVQASLAYERGTSSKTFDVVTGAEFALNGSAYRIAAIEPLANGAKVVVEAVPSGRKRTLEALEP